MVAWPRSVMSAIVWDASSKDGVDQADAEAQPEIIVPC
jgi:hypothetical protein